MTPRVPDDPESDPPPSPPSGGQAGSGSPAWERMHALFDEALELGPAARERFLAGIAGDDPALADEVRSLLAAHDEASSFLAMPPDPWQSRTASPGDRIGISRRSAAAAWAWSIGPSARTRASPRKSRSS
jgi:hypothetical protein